MAETDVAGAITPTVGTAVTFNIGAASETYSTAQVFSSLRGYRISDPLYLTSDAATGSVITWTVVPGSPGSTYTIETSINFGASWDLVTESGQTIPRFLPGDVTTLAVLTRVTLTRLLSSDTSPKITSLQVQVSADSSVDELVPIGHGVVVSAKVTMGYGSGSVGSSGGNGVFGHGGGQSGGMPVLTIKCVDPSRSIAKNTWQKPFTVPIQSYDQAVVYMVKNRLPVQEDFSVQTVNRLTDLLIYGLTQGSDAWQDIRDLGTACGDEGFFNNTGAFVFRPVADPRTTAPVWLFDNSATCTVTQIDRELTDEQTVNYVVVKGESTASANPVSAVAFDGDPSSPTYIYGRFGQHTVVVTIQSVTTIDQAQIAANAILYASIGGCETTTITTVPIPFLECGDCVEVSFGGVKAAGRYVIIQMTTPLSPGEAQTLTCFRQSSQE